MIVNNVILKEKTITVNEIIPSTKMRIDMHRNNLMPQSVEGDVFNCVIENNFSLNDENNKTLLTMKISYLIIVELKNDVYSQKMSDSIYTYLASMYIKAANDLLKETNYPPLPMNINVKYQE